MTDSKEQAARELAEACRVALTNMPRIEDVLNPWKDMSLLVEAPRKILVKALAEWETS